jgi:hypothetical protein
MGDMKGQAAASRSTGLPGSESRSASRKLRYIPLAIGAITFAAGLLTGFSRIGIPTPESILTLADLHGALMISGFLGTLISLERAVAFGRWWGYGAPAISALGAIALLAGATSIAMLCFLLAGAIMAAASCQLLIRHPALPLFLLCVATVTWMIGTWLWSRGQPMDQVVGWWLTFLVLTIIAERLELSRLISPPKISVALFCGLVALLIFGAARGEYGHADAPFTGLGLIGCALWLLRYDIARRTIRMGGATRFAAVCMLAGHLWLGVAGLLLLIAPPTTAAFSYDAVVHMLAIGFVLSMVFGHAPIILPAVTGVRVAYSSFAYLPLALLHVSLMLRVSSDLLGWTEPRAASGLLTALAVIGYAATLLVATRRAKVHSGV